MHNSISKKELWDYLAAKINALHMNNHQSTKSMDLVDVFVGTVIIISKKSSPDVHAVIPMYVIRLAQIRVDKILR